MIAFDSSNFPQPFLVDEAIDRQGSDSLVKFYLTQRLNALPSICFTEIDKAFLVWGTITLFIFSLAQFSLMSWTMQAIVDAALTGAGIAITSRLTWAIASCASLRWVIFLWAGLMSAGTILTAYGVFYSGTSYGGVLILSNLGPLWLGLCAAGYGAMAIGIKSRCFTAACLVHGLAIIGLSDTPSWQFFSSGLIIALTLFFFSVVPWDAETP